jgi:ABC-type multidrug transport system ATPase subunit
LTSSLTCASAVCCASHELDAVEQISTRVIILRSGKIVADDSASKLRELMRSPSLMDVFSQLAIDDDVDRVARDVIETARL